jgi:adenylate cyclase
MTDGRRRAAIRLAIKCVAGLTFTQFTGAVAVALAVLSLINNTGDVARPLSTEQNVIALLVVVPLSVVAGAAATVAVMLPSFRWYAQGREPKPAEQRATVRIAHRQSATQVAIWTVSGVVFTLVNLDAGATVACLIAGAIMFGAITTSCIGFLVTQRTLRPLVAAALKSTAANAPIPGVLARLVIIWALFTGVPSAAIAFIVMARSRGWFLEYAAPVETPVLVLTAMSLLLGFRATVLVARSVSEPVGDVVVAMNDVSGGRLDASVNVYEPSEIGRLQAGFNRMVAGLAERELLRDLFGRHVGTDVARHALEHGGALSGEVREVGVLFVDLVGSTTMTASRSPEQIAQILNDFFRSVVDVVDERKGLINKFAGDAVLAVFGAPLQIDEPASAALDAARALATELRTLHDLDFGIGVSAGSVFAGNIGAENRYEYTVIGDSVNEAARLADCAKDHPSRVLSSGTAIELAGPAEQRNWIWRGSTLLRGRSAVTRLAEPRLNSCPTAD